MTYVAVAATTIIGQLGLVFAPFLLPLAMQQAGLTDTEATRIIGCEFVGYLVVALIAASVRDCVPGRVALVACIAYALGSIGAACASQPWLFFLARLVCGMAGGAVMVSTNRLIASHVAYDRLFAGALIGTVLFAIAALVAVPAVFQSYGASAAYAMIAGFGAGAALLCPWLVTGSRVAVAPTLRFGSAAWVMLAAFFCSRLSDATLWPFTERFGNRVGFDTATIGLILSGATIVAIAGPLVALRATRIHRRLLLFALTLGAKAAAPLLMAAVATPAMFIAVQAVVSITVVLAAQLFLTHFSAVDAGGRLTGLGGTVGLAADAIGVVFAGQTFAATGFGGVAAWSAGFGLVAIALCLPALGLGARRAGAGAGVAS